MFDEAWIMLDSLALQLTLALNSVPHSPPVGAPESKNLICNGKQQIILTYLSLFEEWEHKRLQISLLNLCFLE